VAANFRNRISMQPMRSRDMECRVLLFSLVRGREWREGFSFQGVIGEESGRSTVQCPNWTANSRLSMQAFFCFFFVGGRAGGGGQLEQRLPKFLTCFPKSSQ